MTPGPGSYTIPSDFGVIMPQIMAKQTLKNQKDRYQGMRNLVLRKQNFSETQPLRFASSISSSENSRFQFNKSVVEKRN